MVDGLDPTNLNLSTRLNGEEVQRTTIDDLLFDIPSIIAYCSTFTELAPGDVIVTVPMAMDANGGHHCVGYASDFPGAQYPLNKLNGTWKITDSSLDYVKSEMGTGTAKYLLYLKKKV